MLGVPIEQPVARGRHHHGVEHVVREAATGDPRGDRLGHRRRAEHAALHRQRGQIVGQGVELLGHERDRDGFPGPHAHGVLRGDRGDHAGPEHAELMEGLQVRLDARPASRIGAGDGERDLHVAPVQRSFAY